MIAAGLVNGYDTADMGLVFIHNASPEYPVRPGLFLRPAFREYLRRLNAIPGLAADILVQYLRDPGKDWAEAIDPLGRLLPTGLCDNRPFERFLAQMFTGPGRTNDFRELRRSLYIVATELNSGYSVRFGEPGQDHVPISRAIQASTALPGLYPPVEIDDHTYVDGALMRTMNASLLLDEGADFVICINPLVAFDASSVPRRYGDVRKDLDLTRGGLPVVLSQTFRAMIQSRMLVGMRTYKQSYPTTDVLLFEPDRGDDELFFKNVFRYADRKRLAEHAYQRTRRDLYSHADALEPVLARHGIRLRRDLLSDRSRRFGDAVNERGRRMQPVTGSLHRVLDRLESALGTRA
jgi:predicted acylesterase/phospholipase RssA